MLLCRQCKFVKPDEQFYTSNQSRCKECVKKNAREHRANNIEYYREYDKARANNPDRVRARAIYAKTPEGIEAGNRAKVAWTKRNPVKRQAASAVGNAVRDGKLEKPDACEECGSGGRIHGHHCDYSKVLDVMWLCPACHNDWHKKNGEGLNATPEYFV